MKIFKIIMSVLLGLVLAILALGFALDPKWEVSSRLQIAADKATIFPYINSLQEWPNWTAWNTKNYPETVNTFEGPPWGVGAIQRWDDGNMQGVIRIIKSKTNKSIRYELSMEQEKINMQGRIHLQARGDKTLLVWQLKGDAGENPLGRIMMFVYKPLIIKDLDEGLQNLKLLLEKSSGSILNRDGID
ncbi:MAG: SRPBCC family protein [Thiohalomonadales bacterium]